MDEPAHLDCGMEWLELGTYTLEQQHPPLPRVLMAIGPYWMGGRYQTGKNMMDAGTKTLRQTGNYWGMLSAARVATLFWFLLACGSLYLFAEAWCGGGIGLLAVFFFTLMPSVLTHAGMATNDMAATACLIFLFFCFSRYWGNPKMGNAALCGFALALSLGSKLSLLLFIPLAVLPFVVTLGWPWKWEKAKVLRSLGHGVLFVGVAFFLLWSLYRFDLTSVPRLGNIPLPLVGFANGVKQLVDHNKDGHDAIFWGQYSRHGFRFFFPTLLFMKTPLGILFLSLAGYAALLFRWRVWPVPLRIALWAAPVILAASMTSTINIGLRHVLPIYPFLMLAAALGLTFVPRRIPASALRPVLLLALVVGIGESATAISDPLPWFNVLAPEPKDLVTVDSDLDWGQNLHRLAEYLKQEKIEKIGIRYFGSAPYELVDLPKSVSGVSEDTGMPGYVVVSSYIRRLECLKTGKYCWLNKFQPEHSIGDSLHIYYIPGMGLDRR